MAAENKQEVSRPDSSTINFLTKRKIGASLAHRKSYVVIIFASSCEKFTKSEIYSNIAQNHFHSSQEVISAHYLHKFMIPCTIQRIKNLIWP